MKPTVLLTVLVPLVLTNCAPADDQPPWHGRMGRFLGLIANCGCSDIAPARMVAEYPKALGGRYPEEAVRAMKGYVELAAFETWDNRIEICSEVCAQRCMVETVVAPLGGRSTGTPPCPVTERDLHLTDGQMIQGASGGFP